MAYDHTSDMLVVSAKGAGGGGPAITAMLLALKSAVEDAFSKIAIPPDVRERLFPIFSPTTEKAKEIAAAVSGTEYAPPGPPTISSLTPSSCTTGDIDFTLHVIGTGFTEASVIHFAGHDEPTTYDSDTDVSTGVKPSLWTAPATVQCKVKNGELSSNEVAFEFSAP